MLGHCRGESVRVRWAHPAGDHWHEGIAKSLCGRNRPRFRVRQLVCCFAVRPVVDHRPDPRVLGLREVGGLELRRDEEIVGHASERLHLHPASHSSFPRLALHRRSWHDASAVAIGAQRLEQGSAADVRAPRRPEFWASLLTLTALEIVLGIDNLIFLSIVSGRLPKQQQALARQLGLALALLGRDRAPVLAHLDHRPNRASHLGPWLRLSWRDIVLLVGGLFLLVKGTMETHHMLEGQEQDAQRRHYHLRRRRVQILILDVVFALELDHHRRRHDRPVAGDDRGSGVAMVVMLVAANPVGEFVNNHPTVKMLALSFLLLVGVALIADGFHFHIPRGYLYFAIFFSGLVEALNLWAARSRKRQRRLDAAGRIVDEKPPAPPL